MRIRNIFSIVLLSGLFVTGGCRNKVSPAPSTPANNHVETKPEAGRITWPKDESVKPSEPDASVVSEPETREKTAEDIRKVVGRFLREAPDEAKSNLPPDLAKKLPLDIGKVYIGPEGNIYIGVWHLSLEDDRALLIYHPPGWSTASSRIWLNIRLVRKDGTWEILPPGVGWTRARRKRP